MHIARPPHFALLILAALVASAAPRTWAQTGSSVRHRQPTAGRVAHKTLCVNVAAVTGATITLAEGSAAPFVASLTSATKLHLSGAGITAGEVLVVRLAIREQRAEIEEAWETAAYEAQLLARRAVCVGKVAETLPAGATAGMLTVRREDGTLLDFRVTEKTQFRRGDAVVTPAAYPAGSAVAVKPRGLPNGGVMASIVADSLKAVEAAHRDTATVWRGTVQTVDIADYFLVITRDDGVQRIVRLPRTTFSITDQKTEKTQGPRKLYYLAELPKLPVIIHLERGERPGMDGARTAVLISVTGHAPQAATGTAGGTLPTAPAVQKTEASQQPAGSATTAP